MHQLKKSPRLYLCIVALWSLLFGLAVFSLRYEIARATHASPLVAGLYIAIVVFIGYFWLNGVKDVVYPAWFWLGPRSDHIPSPELATGHQPVVVLVYCTFNDFNEDALEASMHQDYAGRFYTVILDDSTDDEYRSAIDRFSAEHRVEVVRRKERSGFKAGNLNNFLSDPGREWDYFVLLDSDEVIPENFIARTLHYFGDAVGIVQANHVATRLSNRFQRKFAPGVDSHWPVYQTIKTRYGFMSLLGHGAMISRPCYEAAGGFPRVVAEDICFSIEAREAGYLATFAPDVICEEEFPPDYASFRKRHNKWTQGNMEFIRNNTRKIVSSRKLRWFEKLDIVLFTYSLPLTLLFSLFVVMNVVILPVLGQSMQFPLWMLIPTVIFLFAPMINDVIWHWRRMKKTSLLSYSVASNALFGSMYWTSLKASTKSMFGKSVFLVTPKEAERVSMREAIQQTWQEWTFALIAAAVALATTSSVFPVLLLMWPAMASLYLVVHHQHRKCCEECNQHRGAQATRDR